MRELRLIFGATTAATAAVLAIFMAGLGLGSALLGKWADRAANPLRMYGLLEIAIALFTATTPWLVSLARSLYLGLGGQESLGLGGATVVRLAIAVAIMGVPTVLMGGTLPAAVRAVTPIGDTHRRALGGLYGANTLGAVLGALVATFLTLEVLGTRATLWAGCALGLLAGSLAVSRSRRLSQVFSGLDRSVGSTIAPDEGRPRFVYLMAAMLGFTFFALELVWYRMLGPILGGTAFTFGLILSVALFGIGIGGVAYQAIFRRAQPSWSALAVTCALEAVFTMVPYAIGDWLAILAAICNQAATTFLQVIAGWALVASIVVLPVAIIAGIQFPLLIALLGPGRVALSRHVGDVYAWNTLGAILGSLFAGFGGMPLLTAPGMWRGVAICLAGMAIAVRVVGGGASRRAAVVLATLVIVAVGMTLARGPTAAWRHGGIGARRAAVADTRPNPLRQWINERRHVLLWEADGIESSIGIVGQSGVAFVVGGKTDGNALDDAATQMGASIIGAVLHDDPKSALVIGLGTGESAGWLADMRGMQQVDVVELEPGIDEVARRCKELNRNVLAHPRVRRIYNDGREFVFTTDRTYDVIFSEPSNPYRAGIAALYTAEFYQAVRQRMNEGGLFIQWLQAYEVDPASVHSVVATARSVFPYVEVWQTLAVDLQLVCSMTPIENSTAELQQRIGSETVQIALAQAWNVRDLEGFLSHFVASSQWADLIARAPLVELNTDDRTVLEYSFAKAVGRGTGFSVELLRGSLKDAGFHVLPLRGDAPDWNAIELRRQQMNLLYHGQFTQALLSQPSDRALVEALGKFVEQDYSGAIDIWPAEHRHPASPLLKLVLAKSFAELGRSQCLELLVEAEADHPIDVAAVRAVYYARAGNTALALDALCSFFDHLDESPWLIPRMSEAAFAEAVEVARSDPQSAQRLYGLLSRPFASRRFEYARHLTRVRVARSIDPPSVVEALAVLEPHITWTADILEARAEAYAAVKHPLAHRAARDWLWFRQHETKVDEQIGTRKPN